MEGGLRVTRHCDLGASSALRVNEQTPIVSIITVVFNAVATIENTIQSIAKQARGDVEYIIVDGGSNDGTLDVIRKCDHLIDYWISEPDDGIYDAWNKGVRLAQGKWIGFLGADDIYLKGAIEGYVKYIKSTPDNSLDYISSRVNRTNGAKVVQTMGKPWKWSDFKVYMNVAHVGSLHSRALFEKFGLFDTSYRVCGDYEFLLRPRDSLRAGFLDQITANMSVGGVSDSNTQVFNETARAKIETGKRSHLVSQVEKLVALIKWTVRNLILNTMRGM